VALFVLFCFVSGGPHVRMNWSSFANSVPSFHSVWHLDRIRHTLDSPVMMATFPLFSFFLFSLFISFFLSWRLFPLLSPFVSPKDVCSFHYLSATKMAAHVSL
jgi:hypothetical protein